jgi:hypothetical protein
MKAAASGRILFWRHGSLWIGLAGEPTGSHAHHDGQGARRNDCVRKSTSNRTLAATC